MIAVDIKKPISIQNVKGNVTVTVIDGNNNQTQVHVNEFSRKFALECGLQLIYDDGDFKKDSNTSVNFKEWLDGFQFNLKSIYYEREFRRNNLLSKIKTRLENNSRFLILGTSGTSKSVILMEVLCDYLKQGYRILHNLDIGSVRKQQCRNQESRIH